MQHKILEILYLFYPRSIGVMRLNLNLISYSNTWTLTLLTQRTNVDQVNSVLTLLRTARASKVTFHLKRLGLYMWTGKDSNITLLESTFTGNTLFVNHKITSHRINKSILKLLSRKLITRLE